MQFLTIFAVYIGCYLVSVGWNWALIASGIFFLAVLFDWLKDYANANW
jgi:hypothetical protein